MTITLTFETSAIGSLNHLDYYRDGPGYIVILQTDGNNKFVYSIVYKIKDSSSFIYILFPDTTG